VAERSGRGLKDHLATGTGKMHTAIRGIFRTEKGKLQRDEDRSMQAEVQGGGAEQLRDL